MSLVYKYNIVSSVEHEEHFVVKTANGRYHQLPKPLFHKLVNLQSRDNSFDTTSLSSTIVENLIEKNIIASGEQTSISRSIDYHWRKGLIRGPLLSNICEHLRFTHNLTFLVFYLALMAALGIQFSGEISAIFNYDNFNDAVSSITFGDLAVVLLFILVSGLVHELGHAVAHQKYTGNSYEIGVCINYIIPSFYADVSDTVMLNNRMQKVLIGLSGIYYQLLMLPIAISLFYSLSDVKTPIFITIVLGFQLFFNIFPTMRNDGYWVYRDLLNIKKYITPSQSQPSRTLAEKMLLILAIPGFLYLSFITINGTYSLVSIIQSGLDAFGTHQPFEYVRATLALIYLIFTVKILLSFIRIKAIKRPA